MMKTWRERFRPLIKDVLQEHPDNHESQELALREAYPCSFPWRFGPSYPYKVWRDEIDRQRSGRTLFVRKKKADHRCPNTIDMFSVEPKPKPKEKQMTDSPMAFVAAIDKKLTEIKPPPKFTPKADADLTIPYVKTSETSKQAAETMRERAPRVRTLVLNHIASKGREGTTDEAGEGETGIPPRTYAPRRKELVDLGLVLDSGQRRKNKSGRTATVWISAECATDVQLEAAKAAAVVTQHDVITSKLGKKIQGLTPDQVKMVWEYVAKLEAAEATA